MSKWITETTKEVTTDSIDCPKCLDGNLVLWCMAEEPFCGEEDITCDECGHVTTITWKTVTEIRIAKEDVDK